MEAILVLILAIVAYTYPMICAKQRHHRNFAPIAILNICLGWTIIGWIVALMWAFTYQPESGRAHAQ